MRNTPLNTEDCQKLFIFSLSLIPAFVFIVGIIPTVFLAIGIHRANRDKDFSNIEAAVRGFKTYSWLALALCVCFTIAFGFKYFFIETGPRHDDAFVFSMIFPPIAAAYLLSIEFLFYRPLKDHEDWIEANGFLDARPLLGKLKTPQNSGVDIIKSGKLKQYSVADELTKWAKLKEDGHISAEEFNEARAKLLNRDYL